MRKAYKEPHQALMEADIEVKDPFHLFHKWFEAAKGAAESFEEANSMVLATADKFTLVHPLMTMVGMRMWVREGRPSCRVVLLKEYSTDGFRFFTNYKSRKGEELAANPFAALTFYWPRSNRQIRVPLIPSSPPSRSSFADGSEVDRWRERWRR